ncbi:MAG TPA: NUDIX domain-containing protein [Pirellulaceae bacterium]|nr:NUDIX domain-containing protein [Pirellulaceae bacterium]
MRKRTLRDRAFQSFWRMRRPATLGVRGVVTNERGEVLLVRHTYTPGWHFPGGGVEKLETCALSLKRELQEEAGIEADGLQLVSVHANHAFFPNDHVLVFRVTAWRQGKILQRGEIAEICFADPLNLPDGVTAGTKRRLDELFAGKPPSDLW